MGVLTGAQVTDGRTFADLERDATTSRVRLLDRQSLSYQQIDTATSGRYRIVKRYVSHPARSTLLVDLRFQSLTGAPYQGYVYADPSLTNNGLTTAVPAAPAGCSPPTARPRAR